MSSATTRSAKGPAMAGLSGKERTEEQNSLQGRPAACSNETGQKDDPIGQTPRHEQAYFLALPPFIEFNCGIHDRSGKTGQSTNRSLQKRHRIRELTGIFHFAEKTS